MSNHRNKILDAARRFQSKGQYDKAIGQYRKLVEADRRDVRSLLKIGDLFVRKGDRGSAIETYQQVANHYAQQGFFLKAIAVYKQILKLDPSRLDAQVRLGDMYEQLQLISDAMSVYENVASNFMRTGDTDQALAMLAKMVELDPDHIPVRIKCAEALSRAGRTQEAAREFEQSAQLLKEQGRLDDYIKVAERLLYHRGNDVRVAKDLAETYITRRDPKRALAKLQICFKADPRDVSTLSLLAEAFLMLRQTDKAVSVYREIARIHRESKRLQEQIDALRRILALHPTDADARRALEQASSSGEHYVPPGAPARPPTSGRLGSTVSEMSGASGIMYVEEEVEGSSASVVAELDSEVEPIPSDPAPPARPPRAPGPALTPAPVSIPSLEPMTFAAFQALPLSHSPVAAVGAAARTISPMEQRLELADSFLAQGLFDQARAVIQELEQTLPGHPLVLDKATEIEEIAAASSGVSAVAQPPVPLQPETPVADDEPDYELTIAELSPGDEGFDFVEKLAEELAEVAEIAPSNEGAQMLDVDTVFEQFKQGVAAQISEDDSDTHFDLGIAYKEMGLLSDARREFQVAMADPRRRCLCWTMIGVCCMEEGEAHDAIEAFQSGLESPQKTETEEIGLHYELGDACEAAGHIDRARLHFDFVFQREPDFRGVEQRLQRLGGPTDQAPAEVLMESMDDVNRAFDELIGED